MNHQIRTFILIGMLSVSTLVEASIRLPVPNGQPVNLYKNSYALVVGVSDYERWPDLPGVRTDLDKVSATLKQHGFKVQTLLNPTRSSFDNGIRNFISKYGQNPENRLLVYYAGHGHSLTTRRGQELGYIVPADTPLPEKGIGEFKTSAISMLEIEIIAKQMESRHALFLFDSSLSGSLFDLSRAIPGTISEKTAEPVRQIIMAGTADQTVSNKNIFRRQFISGLKGEADLNHDGFITGTELGQYLENSVSNQTRRAQMPKYGKIRDPFLDKGDIVFLSPKVVITNRVPSKQQQIKSADSAAIELAFWQTVKDSNNADAYRAYLKKYPDGQFASLATLFVKNPVSSQTSNHSETIEQDRKNDESRLKALLENRNQGVKKQASVLKKAETTTETQDNSELSKEQRLKNLLNNRLKNKPTEEKILVSKRPVFTPKNLAAKDVANPSFSAKEAVPAARNVSKANGKTIVVAAWGDMTSQVEHIPVPSYSSGVARQMQEVVESKYPGSQVKRLGWRVAKDINFSSDDKGLSRQFCGREKADYLFVTVVEAGDAGGSRRHPDTAYISYDCKANEIKYSTTSVSLNPKESFIYKKSLRETFVRFIDEYH